MNPLGRALFDGQPPPSDGRARISDHIGFFCEPLERVAESMDAWLQKLWPYATDWFSASLAEALARLSPGNGTDELLMETQSPWVAIFNGSSDPSSPVHYIATKMPCRGLLVDCTEDTYDAKTRQGQPGGVQMTISEGPADSTIYATRRAISATNQCGSWDWHEYGERLTFEQPEHYQARRVRDRFTAQLLEQYCAAMGIRVFDPSFYGPRCALLYRLKK
jgi:hypothetical protein